ncbi:MAG: hypothetical protein K0V04_45180 [Deltaproteobacteria bacterium]|nr:hypothetical protein [Deltaproteobacteria bacterium]
MKPQDHCPTCGSPLGALHDKNLLLQCGSCHRTNPRGFNYCGYCAAPMETTAHRAELADVAAPPGGWPNLSSELVEIRFFLERGELDEAYELLAILRERHPGHPKLTEFARSARGPRPDTQVHRVVDSVLAGSASLNSAMPRRSVPQWNAPAAGDDATQRRGQTQAHEVVPVEPSEGPVSPGTVRKRVARVADREPMPASVPPVRPAEHRDSTDVQAVVPPSSAAGPAPRRPQTDKHLGAVPRPSTVGEVEPVTPPVATGGPKPASMPAPASAAGHTVAVPSLQAPAPFAPERTAKAGKSAKGVARKRALKSRKRSGKQAPVPVATTEPAQRRTRGDRFGQHVLGRLGGKGKGKGKGKTPGRPA